MAALACALFRGAEVVDFVNFEPVRSLTAAPSASGLAALFSGFNFDKSDAFVGN